ncbi:hypothetical protein DMENIID0001_077570 [Sergentomyia squamirostris]
MPSKNVKFSVNIDRGIVTLELGSVLLSSLVKFLAVYRNQIPQNFQMFKFLVNRSQPKEDQDHLTTWNQHQVENQLELARNTIRDYEKMMKAIDVAFKRPVEEAVFLLGATQFTPKEAWHFTFPTDDMNNHTVLQKVHAIVDHTLLEIASNPGLSESDTFSKTFYSTNMYLMLKMEAEESEQFLSVFEERENFSMPERCPVSQIVFENQPDIEIERESVPEKPSTSWYECKISVKGYKHVLVKGKNIWDP